MLAKPGELRLGGGQVCAKPSERVRGGSGGLHRSPVDDVTRIRQRDASVRVNGLDDGSHRLILIQVDNAHDAGAKPSRASDAQLAGRDQTAIGRDLKGDIEMSLRGILRGFGLKVGRTTKAGFASRIIELTEHHPALEAIAKALLAVHEVLLRELNGFEKQVRKLARGDNRVRLLMTAPGVGVVVGLTYVAAIDDPGRFSSSKKVGAHFGTSPTNGRWGDADVKKILPWVDSGLAVPIRYGQLDLQLRKLFALSPQLDRLCSFDAH